MKKTTEKIPTWALCYLVNGDPCGLTDEDIQAVKRWYEELGVQVVSPITDTDGEMRPYFTHYPAFGLPTDVVDCDILYMNVDPIK